MAYKRSTVMVRVDRRFAADLQARAVAKGITLTELTRRLHTARIRALARKD